MIDACSIVNEGSQPSIQSLKTLRTLLSIPSIKKIQLPGIKARGPRIESKPNLHVDFPAALEGQYPETVLRQLIWMHAKTECDPIIRNVRPWAHGRTVAVELPADKLAKVASWGLDNDMDHFPMHFEKLRFWTTFKPSNANESHKDSSEEKRLMNMTRRCLKVLQRLLTMQQWQLI